MVGEEQTGGNAATALNQAGLEMILPELAVTGIALELVPRILANPVELMLTSELLPVVQRTVLVRSWRGVVGEGADSVELLLPVQAQ